MKLLSYVSGALHSVEDTVVAKIGICHCLMTLGYYQRGVSTCAHWGKGRHQPKGKIRAEVIRFITNTAGLWHAVWLLNISLCHLHSCCPIITFFKKISLENFNMSLCSHIWIFNALWFSWSQKVCCLNWSWLG